MGELNNGCHVRLVGDDEDGADRGRRGDEGVYLLAGAALARGLAELRVDLFVVGQGGVLWYGM